MATPPSITRSFITNCCCVSNGRKVARQSSRYRILLSGEFCIAVLELNRDRRSRSPRNSRDVSEERHLKNLAPPVSMEFSHYDYVPNELAEKVIAAHKAVHGE